MQFTPVVSLSAARHGGRSAREYPGVPLLRELSLETGKKAYKKVPKRNRERRIRRRIKKKTYAVKKKKKKIIEGVWNQKEEEKKAYGVKKKKTKAYDHNLSWRSKVVADQNYSWK